ncbi:MAG: phage terminase large subunit [Anaerovoracaceae bacterium]
MSRINITEYLMQLDEATDEQEIKNREYQEELFKQYVLRKNDAYREIREELYREFKSGGTLTGSSGLRKRLASFDLAYFGRAYLPHYFVRKSPKFHEELDDIWVKGVMKSLYPISKASEISRKSGCRRAIAAPRGHAKSTNFTFKDSMHAALYGYKHYILILSDSSEQADGFLGDIKAELEDNAIIHEDFGKQEGKLWKTNAILTASGVKIESIGSGKKIRGRRHRNWRPDLIVLDDIENDENVNTPEQRAKLKNWYFKAVSKAGDTYTDIVYIGTILHYDSLLSKVLENPDYITRKYRGVISFAENQKLWEAWELIFTDLSIEGEERKKAAVDFFKANEEEMLKGAEVLWEDKLSYYELMCMRVSEGEASFNSEIQNDPIDPDNCLFNEEQMDFYDDAPPDFSDPRFILVAANDPSLGKNRKSDTSSIILVALDNITGYMYVVEASIEKRKPDVIIDDAIEMNRRCKRDFKKAIYKFGVEIVQFQQFFKDIMAEKSRLAGEYLPIEEIEGVLNKDLRIKSLQPFIKNKYIKFSRKHTTLLKQLTEYPMGKNDDGPDGLEMAVRLALAVRDSGGKVNYKTVIGRALRFKKGAY